MPEYESKTTKRASLPSLINWAKDNEKACDRTIMKATKMINKIMLIWILIDQWKCTMDNEDIQFNLQLGLSVERKISSSSRCSCGHS